LNKAYEGPVQNAPSGVNVRGYFTRALLEGLRGAAAVNPCGVPASELKKYLERRTPELALADGIGQEPEINNGLPAKDEPTFGTAKPRPASLGPPGAPAQIPVEETLGAVPVVPLELVTAVTGTHVSVLDRKGRSVFSGKIDASHRLTLPRGLYTIAGRSENRTTEFPVALEKPSRIHVFDPRFYTATPLTGRPSSYEYYTHPSREWSHTPTRAPIAAASDSSIFIFVRAASRESFKAGTNVADGLVFLDHKRRDIARLRPEETRRDENDGWVAFHASAPHGFYYLRSSKTPEWEAPIQLFAGYQAQVFLMYRDGPMFQTLKIFLQRGGGFEPRDAETTAIDIALNGIQNHSDLLSNEALDLLLHGKFRDPMLGLVGAHVLLQRQSAHDRIKIVLRNLANLLPQSVDVAALEILARSRKVKLLHNPRISPFTHPPMLRAGMDAVFAASTERPSIIARRSRLPEIAVQMLTDTPWSTWRPSTAERMETNLSWVHLAFLDETKRAIEHKTRNRLRPEQLALQIGVPPQTVRAAIHDLKTLPRDFPVKDVPTEFQKLPFFSRLQTTNKRPAQAKRSVRH
jgi:hypothetical protein